jgi:hypothetical protein
MPVLLEGSTIRRALLALSVLLVTGCASDVTLRNAKTGQTATCKGGSRYGLGGHFAQQDQMRCIDDFQRQGYERVPD